MQKGFINLSIYLLYLLPFAILTGPFFPDLFISIIGIIFLIITIINKQWKYFKNNYFYLFITFYFYLIFSSINSNYFLDSLEGIFFYFRFIIFALGVWFLIDEEKKLIRNFALIFIATFLLALIDGYYQYFNGQSLFGYTSPGDRLNLLLNDDRILGGYISRLLPLLIAVIIFSFKNEKKSNLFFLTVLLIAANVLVYLTGERTAIGLMILSLFLFIMFLKKFKKIKIITIIISLMIIIIVTVLDDKIKNRNIIHTFKQISGTIYDDGLELSSKNLVIFSPQHHSLYLTAWKVFLDNSILGTGSDTFRYVCSEQKYAYDHRSCNTHPHNTYLQLLSEIGIIGITFVLIIFSYIFRLLFYNLTNKKLIVNNKILNGYQKCLLICFMLTLFPMLPTQNFFNNWINVIYYLPIGFYLHSIYSNKKIDDKIND
jgi:O-antigen ligase